MFLEVVLPSQKETMGHFELQLLLLVSGRVTFFWQPVGNQTHDHHWLGFLGGWFFCFENTLNLSPNQINICQGGPKNRLYRSRLITITPLIGVSAISTGPMTPFINDRLRGPTLWDFFASKLIRLLYVVCGYLILGEFHCCSGQIEPMNKTKTACLGYIRGWNATQLCGDENKPRSGSLLNNQ